MREREGEDRGVRGKGEMDGEDGEEREDAVRRNGDRQRGHRSREVEQQDEEREQVNNG